MISSLPFDGTLEGWVAVARGAAAAGRPPAEVGFVDTSAGEPSIFAAAASPGTLRVPREFPALMREVALHRDRGKWPLLYRLLWRLTHGEPRLLEVAADEDVLRAQAWAKSVHRDLHRMRAFVRFEPTEDEEGQIYVAWYRPDHLIAAANAPFFRDRFASQRWSILTSDATVHWDGRELIFGPGAAEPRRDGKDEVVGLWATYYRSTFNPARLKWRTMQGHIPRRFWPDLPELAQAEAMRATAAPRQAQMIAAGGVRPLAPASPPAQPPPAGEELPQAVQACRACRLWQHATCAVWGEGPKAAKIVLIGEQPGDQEDRAGRPFVGPAGQLLNRALAAAGIERAEVYLTNAVKHFKWERRGKLRLHVRPAAPEVAACRPWLEAELSHLRPRVLVCLGATAAASICREAVRIGESRGQLRPTEFGVPALITVHPSALLRLVAPADPRVEFDRLVTDLRVAAAAAAASAP